MVCHIDYVFDGLLFHYYNFPRSIAVGFVGAAELQCAADGDGGAIDLGGVFEGEDIGGGVVDEGVLGAVDSDGAGVGRAVVAPEERDTRTGLPCAVIHLTTPAVFPEVEPPMHGHQRVARGQLLLGRPACVHGESWNLLTERAEDCGTTEGRRYAAVADLHNAFHANGLRN